MDEKELDRLAFEAARSYDFKLATLVRQLRDHRSILRRYVSAQKAATQGRTEQFAADTQALLEAYREAWDLLGEPALGSAAGDPGS